MSLTQHCATLTCTNRHLNTHHSSPCMCSRIADPSQVAEGLLFRMAAHFSFPLPPRKGSDKTLPCSFLLNSTVLGSCLALQAHILKSLHFTRHKCKRDVQQMKATQTHACDLLGTCSVSNELQCKQYHVQTLGLDEISHSCEN